MISFGHALYLSNGYANMAAWTKATKARTYVAIVRALEALSLDLRKSSMEVFRVSLHFSVESLKALLALCKVEPVVFIAVLNSPTSLYCTVAVNASVLSPDLFKKRLIV